MRLLPLCAALLASCGWSTATAGDALLKDGDLVAVCGDSITEQKDYSVDIEDYLVMCQPAGALQALQFGWGGETSWGFLARMANDALPFHPTVATTCYGMNDGGYSPLTPERSKQYHDAQKGIVAAFKKAGVRVIVVGAPGCVDAQTFHNNPESAVMYNKTLAELGDIARQVASEEGVLFADVHGVMIAAMTKAKAKLGANHQFAGGDGVHPGRNGHLAMAYAFLKALGCDGAIGTITVDLAANTASASAGHQVTACANGEVLLTSMRYPFCFSGDPAQPTTRSAIEFLPFNQDLNRLTLVVTHAPAENLAVTWGKETKTFPAATLATGINLAAEFPDNPFVPFFAEVESHVRGQQIFETTAVKDFLHNVPRFTEQLPSEKETWSRLAGSWIARAQEMRQESAKSLKPVVHRIVIAAAK